MKVRLGTGIEIAVQSEKLKKLEDKYPSKKIYIIKEGDMYYAVVEGVDDDKD